MGKQCCGGGGQSQVRVQAPLGGVLLLERGLPQDGAGQAVGTHSSAHAPVVRIDEVRYIRVMSGISKYHSSKPAISVRPCKPARINACDRDARALARSTCRHPHT